ncbi:MAG: hypothetical protein ACJAQS_001926 [Porticoccus sp.]|jgi:hypothetical protein
MNNKLLPLGAISIVILLSACAGKQAYRDECAIQMRAAWEQLDVAEAKGFAGSVSYTKALSMLTAGKTMQTFENFDTCVENAKDARVYIGQSLLGQ